MNTTQLECFLAVANYLNFSRAAEYLRITQPAVSHQVNTLEDELGVKLFHRNSKMVRLTQAGHLFTQYAGDILKLTGLSKARMRECQETLPQRLGIGCRNFIELRLLGPVLARMREEMPNLVPALRLVPFASLDNLLEEGDVQMLLSMQEAAPTKAVYRELAQCPLACICVESHPLAAHSQLTLRQLREGGRIATCPPSIYPPSLFAVQSQVVSGRSPDQMMFCDNLELVYTLVESGYAFAVMPDFPAARFSKLRYIPLSGFQPLSFGAVYRNEDKDPALKLFLSYLEALMREGSI